MISQRILTAFSDLIHPIDSVPPQLLILQPRSGGIISAMEDMLEKAEAQRSDGQKAEMEAAHTFAMLKQSLEDAIKVPVRLFSKISAKFS